MLPRFFAYTALALSLTVSGAAATTFSPLFPIGEAEAATSCDGSFVLFTQPGSSSCSESDATASGSATATTLKSSAASTG